MLPNELRVALISPDAPYGTTSRSQRSTFKDSSPRTTVALALTQGTFRDASEQTFPTRETMGNHAGVDRIGAHS